MAVVNLQKLTGNWATGVALDIHTVSSSYLGVDQYGHDVFDTVRSELGELLHRLKYKGDQSAAPEIIATAAQYLAASGTQFDVLVPVPPSTSRVVQPVITMANGIAATLGVPVANCIETTRSTTQLKEVFDPVKRKELLAGLYVVDAEQTNGKNVLLFDDLFRSGSTMNAITDVLLREGSAATVHALAITRTRSHK